MVVTKDRPHGPGRSVPMFIVVECEDHSAIQVTVYDRATWLSVESVKVKIDFGGKTSFAFLSSLSSFE